MSNWLLRFVFVLFTILAGSAAIAKDLPKELGTDLIMIGATGLNAVERLLIGSVTEYVTRTADYDVLVVRTDLDNKPALSKEQRKGFQRKD